MSMDLKVSYLELRAITTWAGLLTWLLAWKLVSRGWCARKRMPRIRWYAASCPHSAKLVFSIFSTASPGWLNLIFYFLFLTAGNRSTLAMASTVTSLLQISLTNPWFGQRLGVAGRLILYMCYKIPGYCSILTDFLHLLNFEGLPSLVVHFINALFRIWHLQLLNLYRKEDPLLTTTWLGSLKMLFSGDILYLPFTCKSWL